MSALNKSGALVVGGPPRAELLPPEVAQGVRARALRRSLVALVILVVAVTATGVVGATIASGASLLVLNAEVERGNQLLKDQAEFAEVRQIKTMIGKAEEGLELGSSTEIRWSAYLAEIAASLPAGTTVTDIAAVLATPTQPYAAPTIPLQGERIGELTFTATTATLPDVEVWLNGLETVTGFVDATPGSVDLDANGTYTVKIVMHINSDVFENRFSRSAAAEEEAAGDGETTDEEGTAVEGESD